MHVLVARLLQGAALAAALAAALLLSRALHLLFTCLRAKRQFLASPLPGPPLPSAIIGHIPDVMGPRGIWCFVRWAQQYGPLYKMQFLNQSVVVLTDPDAIARMTKRTGPGPYMPKPREFYKMLELAVHPQVPNILTSDDGEYWKAVRSAAAPCFSASNMKKVVPLVLELTQRVAARMSASGGVFDITDGAKRITSDVMGHLLYGEDLGGTLWGPNQYLDLFYPVLRAQAALINNPWYMQMLWDPEVRFGRACIKVHNSLMHDKVARLRAHPPEEHTIAAHLLKVVDPATGQPLDQHKLKAEVATFMAAGFETTSHAITWCTAMLAAYPAVQEQVFEELQGAGLAASAAGPGRVFEAADWGRLPLLAAVIKETLRLCPPAPFGGTRHIVTEEGADVCGHHLPKGTTVMIPLLPLGLAKHAFGPDALEFRPERWMGGAGGAASPASHSAAADGSSPRPGGGAGTEAAADNKQHSGGGSGGPPDPLTFLAGPRDCIGQNLAKLELQVVLATLLGRFRFGPGPELAQELAVAAATGQPPVAALHALAGVHITLQPLSGRMELSVTPRAASRVTDAVVC